MVAAIVGGLLTMAIYMKRAVMGYLRAHVTQIGEPYEPRRTHSLLIESTSSESTALTTLLPDFEVEPGVTADVTVATTTTPHDVQSLAGCEVVGPPSKDLWDTGPLVSDPPAGPSPLEECLDPDAVSGGG
jgi:hypothetical protein